MKLIRNAFAASVAVAALAVVACSGRGSSIGTTASNTNPGNVGVLTGAAGDTGTVGARLTIATGVNVTSLNWTIKNATNSYTGTVNIGDAQSVEWVAGGIFAGSGYSISVTGTDTSGDPCTGSTPSNITVSAGTTTQAVISVTCIAPPDAAVAADVTTGSLEVDASVVFQGTPPVQCPGINSFSINPAEITLGQTSQLNVATTSPTPIITWSVSPAGGGSFSSVNSAAPTFQCTAGGTQVTVTATVSLAADAGNSLCFGADGGPTQPFESISALVNCEGTGIVCLGGTTACGPDGGTQVCVNEQTDVNNCGGCGIVCPTSATGTTACQAGVCKIIATPPTACTSAPCGANTVTCPASANGVCTATEQLIINHDILKNNQAAGAPSNSSCYACLVLNACLDSSGAAFPAGNGSGTPVTNSECGDPNGAGVNFPFDNPNASTSNPAACLSALSCVLTSNGTNPSSECSLSQVPPSVSNCYCGANTGSSCLGSPADAIGVCASTIDTDIGQTDPTTVLSHFTDTTYSPGSVGLQVLNCGLTSPATPPAAAKCPTCFN